MATLTGSDSYDPSTGWWTYSYTVDNSGGPATVGDFGVMVIQNITLQPRVAPYTVPQSNWTMFGSFSGSIINPPYNEHGGFYEFYAGDYSAPAIQPGQIVSGFSFISLNEPTDDGGANDYFLYGCVGGNDGVCGVQGYGNVVVPYGDYSTYLESASWNPVVTPVPSSVSLFITGVALLCGVLRSRARRRTT